MSLLRLLSTGKSLVGLQESNPRYRMGDPRSMPKFGSVNPFQRRKPSPPPERPVAANVTPAAPTAPTALATVSTPVAKPTAAAAAPARIGWWARWRSLWSWRRQPAPAPVVRPAIQGELSLDRVKVMRNDLSDSDLEVVAAPRRAKASADPVLLLAPDEPAPESRPLEANSALREGRLVEASRS